MSREIPHIVLVACAAGKREVPQPARNLYDSQLFAASRAYAEIHGDRWYILSALHGVVEPDELISPYERTLNAMPVSQRRDWAEAVNEKLSKLIPAGSRLEILAGQKYREFIVPFLKGMDVKVEEPLARLRVGEQVQWLKRQVAGLPKLKSDVNE